MSRGPMNWMSVLHWWWARPKSIGMSVVVLLVAGGLYLLEQRQDAASGSASSRSQAASVDVPADDRSIGEGRSVESLVVATQAADTDRSAKPSTNSSTKASPPASTGRKTDPRRDMSPAKPSQAKSSQAKPAQEPLGKLTKVSGKTYRTTAGLVYTPGSREGHRLKHVAAHFRDDRSKPVHGVFSGSERENFAAIDEAYLIATTDPRDSRRVRRDRERDRTTFEVNLDRRVGYVGGQKGQRSNRELTCTAIKLVLEDDRVITAFPMQW